MRSRRSWLGSWITMDRMRGEVMSLRFFLRWHLGPEVLALADDYLAKIDAQRNRIPAE